MKIEKDFKEGYIKISYKRIAIWLSNEWVCPHESKPIDFVQMGYLRRKRRNSKSISITLLGFGIGFTLYDKR